jgi:hypothetical protein
LIYLDESLAQLTLANAGQFSIGYKDFAKHADSGAFKP